MTAERDAKESDAVLEKTVLIKKGTDLNQTLEGQSIKD